MKARITKERDSYVATVWISGPGYEVSYHPTFLSARAFLSEQARRAHDKRMGRRAGRKASAA